VAGLTLTLQTARRTRASRYTILTYADGYADGYAAGNAAGYATGYAAGFIAGEAAEFASIDTTPPTITVVSPTPGVAPGSAGGFPADRAAAAATPIVVQITDTTPGNALVVVIATFLNPALVEAVYHRGAFLGPYAASSWQVSISNGIELHCVRTNGWPGGTATNGDIKFDVDAIDRAGNLAS